MQNVPTSELEDNDWIDSFLNEHSHVDNYTADTIPVLPHIDFQTTFPLLLSPEEAQSQERKMYFIKTEGDRKSSTQAGGTSTQGDQKGLGFQLQLIDLKTLTGNCSQQPQPVTASDHGLVANKTDQAESQKEEVLDDASLSSELSSCTDGIPLMDSRNQISAQVDPKLITIDDLRQLFDYPMGEASLKLGIGPTTMKKICRKHGVKRWPYRHRQSLLKMKAKVMQVSL